MSGGDCAGSLLSSELTVLSPEHSLYTRSGSMLQRTKLRLVGWRTIQIAIDVRKKGRTAPDAFTIVSNGKLIACFADSACVAAMLSAMTYPGVRQMGDGRHCGSHQGCMFSTWFDNNRIV